MTEPTDTSWEQEALPILKAVLQAKREGLASVDDDYLREQVQLSSRELSQNLELLSEADYIDARSVWEGGGRDPEYDNVKLKVSGLRVLGDWPNEQVAYEALLHAFQNHIDRTDEPEIKSALQRLLDGIQNTSASVGQQTIVAILADFVQRMPLHL